MPVWYCCQCNNGPMGTAVNLSCSCNHARCTHCSVEQGDWRTGYTRASVPTAANPVATTLATPHLPHETLYMPPPPPPPPPQCLFPSLTYAHSGEHITHPHLRACAHTYSISAIPQSDGGEEYQWYCCERGYGGNSCILNPSCSMCNYHQMCERCKVECIKK